MTIRDERTAKTAALNDALRRDPGTGEHGRIVMTRGVRELGIPFTLQVLAKLKAYSVKKTTHMVNTTLARLSLKGKSCFGRSTISRKAPSTWPAPKTRKVAQRPIVCSRSCSLKNTE